MFKKRAAKQEKVIKISQNQNNQQQRQIIQNQQNQQNQQKQQQQQKQQELSRQNPQKKIKIDNIKNQIIFSSTIQRKQLNQESIHKQFKQLNYKAVQNIININPNKNIKQEILLQQQLAKQKYMHNVQITQKIKQGTLDTSLYRGLNSYANYALTEDQIVNAEQKFRKRQGPSRVNSTIRNTCRFDYNFGLCKDWHDSGYCPFGDSCLYLHDRSNYKTGWEQQKDFQKAQKQRWKRINNPELALKQQLQQSLKSIQKFKVDQLCLKCNQKYKTPVQVDCGHVFCSSCAIKLSKCCKCNKILSGIMNNAQKKINKMKLIYEQLKAKVLKQNQQSKVKRKKYQDIDSQNVFAD